MFLPCIPTIGRSGSHIKCLGRKDRMYAWPHCSTGPPKINMRSRQSLPETTIGRPTCIVGTWARLDLTGVWTCVKQGVAWLGKRAERRGVKRPLWVTVAVCICASNQFAYQWPLPTMASKYLRTAVMRTSLLKSRWGTTEIHRSEWI